MPLPAGRPISTGSYWRNHPMLRRMLPILAAVALTLMVVSMASEDVENYLDASAKAHNDAADARELLLREQQRLNQPDGSENLAGPVPAGATVPPRAQGPESLRNGLRVVLREVGDRSRHRQAQTLARIEALHLERQLLPEVLLGAEGTRAGRLVNRQYIDLLNYSLAIKQASYADLARRLRALVGEGADGRAMMLEFNRNLARQNEEDAALASNRRATVEKIERLYDLADAQRQSIDLDDDGNLIFADAETADRYRRLMSEIDALIEQRDRIFVQRQARLQVALDEIERQRR